jgi:four helix bundle protein
MGKSVVKDKSYLFALRIIKLYQYLAENKKEYVLSKQVLRCGTAVGAMVREGEQAESKADFIHKMAISLKEANETEYWLNLIKDSDYIDKKMFDSLVNDCKELIALLTAIIKTTKSKK